MSVPVNKDLGILVEHVIDLLANKHNPYTRNIPLYMPDGTEVKSVADVSVLLGMPVDIAAIVCKYAKNTPPHILDEAKRIRRVRTPEGARRYGQPIGTVIQLDIPERHPDISHGPSVRQRRGKPNLAARKQPDKPRRLSDDVKIPEEATGAEKVADRFRLFNDEEKKAGLAKNKRKKSEVSQLDYWPGIYGLDFQYEDDPIGEIDPDDYDERKKLADWYSEYLGVKVEDTVHVDTHEVINALMEAYEDMYPGFGSLVKEFRMSRGSEGQTPFGTAIAWNLYIRHEWDDPRKQSLIGLGHKHYHPDEWKDPDDQWDRMVTTHQSMSREGWWALNWPETVKAAEKTGLTEWQLAHVATLTHELGHTFMSIAAEESTRESEHSATRDIFAVMEEYAVSSELVYEAPSHVYLGDRSAIDFDNQQVRQLLSEYGTKNLQEMAAEAWTEYMLSPNPRAYAREIGDILSNYMVDHLAKQQGGT